MDILRTEPSPKWIRGKNGDETVVDTRRALLVWEHEYYPWWYIPEADVLDPTLPTTAHPDVEGSVLEGYVKVDWSAVDRWFEEDVEVFVHPRDPYRRVDALASSRHVVIRIDGTVVADSHAPVILYETGLPPRYYLPADDVRLDLLAPTDTSTGCPYKGVARYWTATVDGTEHRDIVWGYDDPLPESGPVKGLLCFYNEKVEVEIDGVVEPQPTTKFS